jgi:homoprotocatechuate degradation regulator HpaR
MTDPTPLRPTQASLPMALLRAREAVMRHFRPLLDSHGLSEQQWRVLRVLAETDALDATELAARSNVLAPSLTRMLRLLLARDLVARRDDPDDGRRLLLRITGAGQALIDAAGPMSNAIHDRIAAQFGPEAVADLLVQLDRLAQLAPPDTGSARR